jgi:hypothetical protein
MRRKITKEFYDALIAAFNENPGNYHATMHKVRKDPRSGGICGYDTVKRAWLKGWPDEGLWPIKDIVEADLNYAKAMGEWVPKPVEASYDYARGRGGGLDPTDPTVADMLQKEKAREDAILARTAEATIVKETRQDVIRLLDSAKRILGGYDKLTPKILKYLEEAEIDTDIDVTKAVELLWKLSISLRSIAESGMKVLQMERLLLSQPMEIVGVKDVDDITEEDALRELEEAAKAAERIRERRQRRYNLSCKITGNLKSNPFVSDYLEGSNSEDLTDD